MTGGYKPQFSKRPEANLTDQASDIQITVFEIVPNLMIIVEKNIFENLKDTANCEAGF